MDYEMLSCGIACLVTGAGVLAWRRDQPRSESAWDAALADLNVDQDAQQDWVKSGRWRPLGWVLVVIGAALVGIFIYES